MKNTLYFVSSKQPSFWNKNLNALINYDFRKLSQDQSTIVLFKQGQILKRQTARRYKIYKQHLFYFRETGEIGGFIILKNVYLSVKLKDNNIIIVLQHDLQQLLLQNIKSTDEIDQFILDLKNNCIQESPLQIPYIYKEKIGEGITSEVFRVISDQNQQFAIKKVQKASFQNKMREKQAKSLAEEIFLMRTLDHPNIPKLFEVYENENHVHLIMTYYSGKQLMEKIQNFTLSQKQQLIKTILETMCYVHSEGIMHRDLKPQNIIYKDDDPNSTDIAIIDFGFATNMKYTDHVLYNCGTVGYAAPEVSEYRDKSKMYTTQCDVYSLGVIIYEIFFNHPFKQSAQGSVTFDDKTKVPSSLKNIITQMTRQNPRYRFTLKECLDQDFFKENFENQNMEDLNKYPLVDSVSIHKSFTSLKNSNDHSLLIDKQSAKLDNSKQQKTGNSTSESKQIFIAKSNNLMDSQLGDLQFNEHHNCPKDFDNLLQVKKL